ncbi:MAG: hypothetical protein EVA43_05970 [Flavobacteriales bacterium]|nr:MAG: hypothetical protein EVA43_05970 [Flavobacteriales bacterium]
MSSLIYKKYNINHKVNDLNITYKKYTTLLVSSEAYNKLEKELKSNSMAVYRSQNEIILKDRNIAIKKMPEDIYA